MTPVGSWRSNRIIRWGRCVALGGTGGAARSAALSSVVALTKVLEMLETPVQRREIPTDRVASTVLVPLLSVVALTGCRSTIDSVEPGFGVPGEQILIRGQNLTGSTTVNQVAFGGGVSDLSPVPHPTDVDAVLVTVPAGAQTGKLIAHVTSTSPLHVGSTAESPLDFVVNATPFPETEPNDSQSSRNNVGSATTISGVVSESDQDWFQLDETAGGTWAGIMEMRVTSSDSIDVDVWGPDVNAPGGYRISGFSLAKSQTGWISVPASVSILLHVTTPSITGPVSYEIQVARIPVNDSTEVDDDGDNQTDIASDSLSAATLSFQNDTATVSSSVLVPIWNTNLSVIATEGFHYEDYFRFDVAAPATVSAWFRIPNHDESVDFYIDRADGLNYATDSYRLLPGTNNSMIQFDVPPGASGPHLVVLAPQNLQNSDPYGYSPVPAHMKLPYSLLVKVK